MKRTSLVRRVITGVLVAEFVCAALLSGLAVAHSIRGRQHALDVVLRGRADSVLGAIRDAEDPEDNAVLDPNELQLPSTDAYLVMDPHGGVLGESPALRPEIRKALGAPGSEEYFRFRSGQASYRGIRVPGVRVVDRDDNGGIRRAVLIVYATPTHFLWHEALETVRFYVIGGILLLAITAAGLAWFLRRSLTPLEELASIAAAVTPHTWDFAAPTSVSQTRELAPIAESLKQLLGSLRAAFERQRQLTGDAAHELKTSIAVLKSSVQLLGLTRRTTAEYEAGLEGLLLDIERTESLANRMLSLARLEETAAETGECTDMAEAVVRVLDRLRPIAEQGHIELASTLDSAPIGLTAENAEVLCSNLVMNALQHSGENGHILVRVTTREDDVVLQVIDDGEGIPKAALPHIFERFYRADTSRTRKSGGAGLGLSICKVMVERVSGRIDVRSTVGVGTEITVSLPRARSCVAREPTSPTETV